MLVSAFQGYSNSAYFYSRLNHDAWWEEEDKRNYSAGSTYSFSHQRAFGRKRSILKVIERDSLWFH